MGFLIKIKSAFKQKNRYNITKHAYRNNITVIRYLILHFTTFYYTKDRTFQFSFLRSKLRMQLNNYLNALKQFRTF